MTTEPVIEKLSTQSQQDIATAGQWLNPIPTDAKALLDKITIALQMVKYSHNRQGASAETVAQNEHLQALERLKVEVSALLK